MAPTHCEPTCAQPSARHSRLPLQRMPTCASGPSGSGCERSRADTGLKEFMQPQAAPPSCSSMSATGDVRSRWPWVHEHVDPERWQQITKHQQITWILRTDSNSPCTGQRRWQKGRPSCILTKRSSRLPFNTHRLNAGAVAASPRELAGRLHSAADQAMKSTSVSDRPSK